MSSACREVVTLQLGHYSNFVGTHWWNLQEASLSYDPDAPQNELQSDVVFREGQTLGGHVTYTPRLIAMDLKGSLQTLRQEGCLYDSGKDTTTVAWEGHIMMHKESPTLKNMFLQDLEQLDNGEIMAAVDFDCGLQPHSSELPPLVGATGSNTVNSRLERLQSGYRLEGSVRVWSDFLRIHLHPRTVSVIHLYNHDGETHRLEAFSQGEGLLQGPVLEDLEDRLHFFVEECDYLQGFQVLCDLADGFAGLGSKVTEMLHDSYDGRGIFTWGLAPISHPNSTPIKDIFHLLNYALGTVHLANHSSIFCPLTLRGGLGRRPTFPTEFPHLNYDPSLWYHSSAVLGLALDALTVPFRLRHNSIPLWQMADALAISGRKVVAAYGAVPFPMMQGGSLPDALTHCADALPWKPLSSCHELGDGRCYGQLVTLRGLASQEQVSCLAPGTQPPTPLHGLRRGEDVLSSYINAFYPASPLALQLVSEPSKLTPPFPQIFSQDLDQQGLHWSQAPPPSRRPPAVTSVPVLTCLQSGPGLEPWLAELHRASASLAVRRAAPSFLSQGLEADELHEALEQLRNLARCYRDDSGGTARSSSEDDD